MPKVKIKSFDEAVQVAIESDKESHATFSEGKPSYLFGIYSDWVGWGNVVEACEADELDTYGNVVDNYYYDGEFYIPSYCVEYVTED